MNLTAQAIENLTLHIAQEIHVNASLDATFAALLEEMGPSSQGPDGKPMAMKIEVGDDLHGARFGGAGDRARREQGREQIQRPHPWGQLGTDRRGQLPDRGIAL